MAAKLAERSTCKKAHVGVIITDWNGVIVASGYNGSLPSAEHCEDVGCLIHDGHCIRTIHAEANAIIRISFTEHVPEIGYCTHQPCLNCLKMGLTKGILAWYYSTPYKDEGRDKFVATYNTQMGYEAIRLCHVSSSESQSLPS